MNSRMEKEFLEAYDEWADAIYRHCFFRVYDREIARDLVQECFVKIWQYLSDGGEIRQMKAFVYRVANNLIIDYSRKKKESSLEAMMEKGFDLSLNPSPSPGEGDEVGKKIDFELVLKVLDQVEQPYRDAVIMRYIDDLSPKEIAEIIGESENVVSVRVHRGIKQLRSLIQNDKLNLSSRPP